MSLHSCRWTIEALGFDLEPIIENYKSWVVVPFYVVVSGWNEYKKGYEFGCFRSPKRGDRKYSAGSLAESQTSLRERCMCFYVRGLVRFDRGNRIILMVPLSKI